LRTLIIIIVSPTLSGLATVKLVCPESAVVVIGISDQMKIPVKYIGVGEKMTDLQPFNKKAFVDSLFGE
jgi:fused signal recognition particle receptor